MKTAISIPDSIFQAADHLAQRLGVSRSELYVKAVSEYVSAHRYQDVKKLLDEVYKSETSAIDEEVSSIQFRSLPKEDWD